MSHCRPLTYPRENDGLKLAELARSNPDFNGGLHDVSPLPATIKERLSRIQTLIGSYGKYNAGPEPNCTARYFFRQAGQTHREAKSPHRPSPRVRNVGYKGDFFEADRCFLFRVKRSDYA